MADMLFLKLSGENFEGEEPVSQTKGMTGLIRIYSYSHGLSLEMAPLRPSAGEDARMRRSMCSGVVAGATCAIDFSSAGAPWARDRTLRRGDPGRLLAGDGADLVVALDLVGLLLAFFKDRLLAVW